MFFNKSNGEKSDCVLFGKSKIHETELKLNPFSFSPPPAFLPLTGRTVPPAHLHLQENVSCLNTSLVILMLARRRSKLPFYLDALREKEYAEKYPGCLLNNFHNLLRFWQRHYLNKDKDSTCLENVSPSPPCPGSGLWSSTSRTV